jgi:hypothetical protein
MGFILHPLIHISPRFAQAQDVASRIVKMGEPFELQFHLTSTDD